MSSFKSSSPALALLAAAALAPAASARSAATMSVADRISAIVDEAVEYPVYPTFREPNEGIVLVGFVISASAKATDIRIVASSGHQDLDQAALNGVAKLHDLPLEAAGRRATAVLQFRVGAGGYDPSAVDNVRRAIARLRKRQPDLLIPTGSGD